LCCETNRNRPYVFLFIRQLIVGFTSRNLN
jgi:hypothetical protein